MKINEVEQIAGITKKNIRFYEEQGLIHPKRNIGNDYREYSREDAELLLKIKLLRKLDVPIEEIRRIIDGEMTLSDCLDRHKVLINHETDNLRLASEMCDKIRAQNKGFQELDSSEFLREMALEERKGAKFVNVRKTDVRKKKLGAIASAGIIILLILLVLVTVYFANLEDPAPLPVLILVTVIPAAVIIGLAIALVQRINEINGGEENDASNY